MPPVTGYVPPKRDFIGKPAPPGYVAGIGRGATGFTTRSDIGPARESTSFKSQDDDSAAGPSAAATKRIAQAEDEDAYLNESNYDEFAGYRGSLFKQGEPYEDDDKEADKIYAEIDKHMDERGKAIREARARQELELYRQKRPKIQQQFMDLKSELRNVSENEWAAIPDVGDARNRKQRVARQDKFTPVPDTLLAHQAKLSAGGERLVYLDTKAQDSDDDDDDDDNEAIAEGIEDDDQEKDQDKEKMIDKKPILDGQSLNTGELNDFRSSVLSMKLSLIQDNASSSSTSNLKNSSTTTGMEQKTSNINAHDYLTNLQSTISSQISDSSTVTEYRKQFAALRASNPTFQNAWIASVRLEEAAGKLKTARELIMEACRRCPNSPDLWLEAARLQPRDVAKRLMVEAIKAVPRSERLWIKAAELEPYEEIQRRVYEKARRLMPKSEALWKRSIELEQPEQARLMLRDAVECCPQVVDFWLALARLLPYEEANQVLKEANEKNPRERAIWLTAAKLQEQVGKVDLVEKIIQLSVTDLASKGVPIERREWLHEAAQAERANFRVTCREIIKRIIGWNINETDNDHDDEANSARLKLWLSDAKSFIENQQQQQSKCVHCARTVFECILEDKAFARLESVWLERIQFERLHGDSSSLISALHQAIEPGHCRSSESLWLELAHEKRNELNECRRVLTDALAANPDSEKIVLAAVQLELDNSNVDIARRILSDACASARTAELMLRLAKLEWSAGQLDEAEGLLVGGAREFKSQPQFYLYLGQLFEERGVSERAKSWYSEGLKYNPTSVELWVAMAQMEEKLGHIPRARSKLESARLRNPRNVQLWLEAVRLEWKQFLTRQQQQLINCQGGVKAAMSTSMSTTTTAAAAAAAASRARPDLVLTTLAKAIKECKDCPDVGKLHEMQADISKRKFG